MKIGFALSSGGPYGAAHLGVIKRLEEENIVPDIVTGTSVGAIVGGLYGSGKGADELIDVCVNEPVLSFFSDYTILGFNRNGYGAVKGERLLNFLKKNSDGKSFDKSVCDLAFVAVDKDTKDTVILKEGSIAEAARASSSIPIVFKPYYLQGRYLVDGAVNNPLPVSVAEDMGADLTIGITYNAGAPKHIEKKDKHSFKCIKDLAFSRIGDHAANSLLKVLEIPIVDKALSMISIDDNLMNHCIDMFNNEDLENRERAQILIESPLEGISDLEDMVKAAYQHTDKYVDIILKSIEKEKKRRSSLVKRLFTFWY